MNAPLVWDQLPPGAFGLGADLPGLDPMWLWDGATTTPGPRWAVIDTGQQGFASLRLDPNSPADRARAGTAWLAEPVRPERPLRRHGPQATGEVLPQPSPAEYVVGVIDDGCPFAVPWLRRADGATRLAGLWDQDEDAPAFIGVGGARPAGLRYGAAIGREALDRLLKSGLSAPALYRRASLDRLRHLGSHGAAVLSQLLAPPVIDAPSRPGSGRPARWDQTLHIDDADLVFVQIAAAAAQDSTSAAMLRHLSDGLEYILAHTVPRTTRRLVVNVSSGSSRTLHDGRSALERCMVGWLERARRHLRHDDVHLVVPAGNTQVEHRHAVLSEAGAALRLTVPPGGEMPQFVTGRWPAGGSSRLRIEVGGAKVTLGRGQAFALLRDSTVVAVAARIAPVQDGPDSVLLAIAPTASGAARRAPAGAWDLTLVGGDPPAPGAEFWVSRVQRNPGAAPRGQQADFADLDRSHRGPRWRRAREQTPPGGAPPPNGPRFEGALSGLATAGPAKGLVTVAAWTGGGLQPQPSRYSPEPRDGGAIDASAPVDRSRQLAGTTVRGNAPGATQRVSGTSFAAPLVARALVNGTLPTPGPGVDPRLGKSVLKP